MTEAAQRQAWDNELVADEVAYYRQILRLWNLPAIVAEARQLLSSVPHWGRVVAGGRDEHAVASASAVVGTMARVEPFRRRVAAAIDAQRAGDVSPAVAASVLGLEPLYDHSFGLSSKAERLMKELSAGGATRSRRRWLLRVLKDAFPPGPRWRALRRHVGRFMSSNEYLAGTWTAERARLEAYLRLPYAEDDAS